MWTYCFQYTLCNTHTRVRGCVCIHVCVHLYICLCEIILMAIYRSHFKIWNYSVFIRYFPVKHATKVRSDISPANSTHKPTGSKRRSERRGSSYLSNLYLLPSSHFCHSPWSTEDASACLQRAWNRFSICHIVNMTNLSRLEDCSVLISLLLVPFTAIQDGLGAKRTCQ